MKAIHYFKVASHFKVYQYLFWLALCHDLVEDGFLPAFFTKMWKDLDAITRKKGEAYFDYIARLQQNPSAKKVKVADLKENMKRCSSSLLRRYTKALKLLEPN